MSTPSPEWQTGLTRLWERAEGRVVVLGIGRRGHGDDAAGPLLIDRLQASSDLAAIDCGTAPENFLGVVARHHPGLALLVDACCVGADAGTIHLLSPDELAHTDFGTHGLTPALFLKMIEQQTGAECALLAIESERVGADIPASPCVHKAISTIAEFLLSHAPKPRTL